MSYWKRKFNFVPIVMFVFAVIITIQFFMLYPKKTIVLQRTKYDVILDYTKSKKITSMIMKYSYDPLLMCALIKIESNYKTKAMSKTGDYGLCQLNKKFYSMYSERELLDIETNIRLGAEHLNMCLVETDYNRVLSLAYYNAGEPKVNNYNSGKSTYEYIEKTMNEMELVK